MAAAIINSNAKPVSESHIQLDFSAAVSEDISFSLMGRTTREEELANCVGPG
jgi:hypothetical protein